MGMTFCYETAESVECWLNDWENHILKDPENIVLGRTLGNVLELALAELQSLSLQKRTKGRIERSESGQAQWAREMLELLEEEFVNDARGRIAMLRKHFPVEVGALEQEVRRGRFDIASTETAIQALLGIDWDEFLFKELESELARGKRYDRSALRCISYMLAELALRRHAPKELKSIPRSVFTREYTRYLLAEHGKRAVASAAVEQAFGDAVTWVLSQTSGVWVVDIAPSNANSLFALSKSMFWQFSIYELIRAIQTRVTDMLATVSFAKTATAEGETDVTWDRVAQKLAPFVVERYIQALYTHALRSEIKKQLESSEDTPLVFFIHLLVDATVEECGFGDIKARDRDGASRYAASKHALEESLVTPLARGLSETLFAFDRVDEPWAKESCIAQMEDWLASELQLVYAEPTPLSIPLSQDAALSVSQELVCRTSFHEALWTYLKPVTALLADGPRIAEAVQSGASDMDYPEGLQKLWTRWQDAVPRYAEMFHLFHSLPWKDLSEPSLSQLVDALSRRINQPLEEWSVFYKVQGLDFLGEKWKLGKVLFYDPKVYDFGEGETFYPQKESLQNLAGVCIDVKANSQFAARAKAHARTEEALDVISFALSVGRDLGGLDPRVLPQVLEIPRASPGYWSGEESIPASNKPTDVKEIKQKDRQILRSYGTLLVDSESGASSLSDIQKMFLKAVRWYRMGRWQDDPIESFLFHWIALESMFAVGERAVEHLLLEKVPRIEITGREVLWDLWFRWIEDWKAAIQGIKGCPALLNSVEQDPNLQGWDHYYHVLLDAGNASKLEQYADAAASMPLEAVQGWVLKVKSLDSAALKEEVERRRAASRYRLHVMYARRNLVVHEAHSFRDASDMAIYAQELQKLLERVLRIIVAEAIEPSSQCQTIEELIDLANRPW